MTKPFASTLSVQGFLGVEWAGFRPLRQVQGTSVVSLGLQPRPSASRLRGSLAPTRIEIPAGYGASTSSVYYGRGALAAQQYLNEGGWFELEKRTAAYNDARRQALARLRESAAELGALAVVDVRVRRGKFAQASMAIEFTALGTAIASDGFALEEHESIPLVSVSGGDFWKLVSSGTWPLGLVGGTSVGYVVSGYRTKYARFRFSRRSFQNQEYEDYTEGLKQARLHAAGRLRQEAREVGATGVLGIEVRRERAEQKDDDLLVTVDLLGNALASIDQGAPPEVEYEVRLGKA
jgi:uncharacterized protein YbjQ (UPF0145 family)